MLLGAAQSVPGVWADLAFFPSAHDAGILQGAGIPFWLATGAQRAPSAFDLVAISLSVPQEALNLPAALYYSGLKLAHADRMADDNHPLVILGGHAAGSAPFIHGDVQSHRNAGGLVDAVCLGDGIAWLKDFLSALLLARKEGTAQRVFLRQTARRLPGAYIPSLYRHHYRDTQLTAIEPVENDIPCPVVGRTDSMETWWKDYDGAYIPISEEETEETLPLSVGCVYRCRFCQTGWLRERLTASNAGVEEAALRLKRNVVPSDLNLLASDACSVPKLEDILRALTPYFRHVSLKSLSLSSLARRPELLPWVQALSKHEFTFGIEGISARLRAYLGKPSDMELLIEVVRQLTGTGLRQLKLFFIATGLETPADLDEFARLIKRLRAQAPGARLIASFMPLFLAPFTPLQFAAPAELNPQVERVLKSLAAAGGEFRWSAPPEEIRLMNRLCRAGRRATEMLVDFSIRHQLRYYDGFNPRVLKEFEEVLTVDDEESTLKTVLPWDDLQPAATKAAIWRAYQKARQDLAADYSESADARSPFVTRKKITPTPPVATQIHAFWAWAGPDRAHQPDHVVARSLLRQLFASWPEGCVAYQGQPALSRPASTTGLMRVQGAFRAETILPSVLETVRPIEATADDRILGLCKPSDTPTDRDDLFQVRWMNLQPAGQLLALWKERGIKYQTVRKGDERWHVIGAAHRTRSRVMALCEHEPVTELFCMGPSGEHVPGWKMPDRGLGVAVWTCAPEKCPRCGQPSYTLRLGLETAGSNLCFDCLLRPG